MCRASLRKLLEEQNPINTQKLRKMPESDNTNHLRKFNASSFPKLKTGSNTPTSDDDVNENLTKFFFRLLEEFVSECTHEVVVVVDF